MSQAAKTTPQPCYFWQITVSVAGFDEETFETVSTRSGLGLICATYRAQGYRHLRIERAGVVGGETRRRGVHVSSKLEEALELARESYWVVYGGGYSPRMRTSHGDRLILLRVCIHRLVLIARIADERRVTSAHAAKLIDNKYPILRAHIEGTSLERDLL
jgi:hypothetical protein